MMMTMSTTDRSDAGDVQTPSTVNASVNDQPRLVFEIVNGE